MVREKADQFCTLPAVHLRGDVQRCIRPQCLVHGGAVAEEKTHGNHVALGNGQVQCLNAVSACGQTQQKPEGHQH